MDWFLYSVILQNFSAQSTLYSFTQLHKGFFYA